MYASTISTLAAVLQTVAALSLQARQGFSDTAFVDLSKAARRGPPKQLASGILYGIPDIPDQIPDHFYTDIGYNYARIGGAQMDAGGWVRGIDAYYTRFNNTRDNYFQARKFGAKVIILPHDIFGTDSRLPNTIWPGDNGDWTDYDKFLDQLLGDLKANNMLDGMIFDIWNEPDLGDVFWARSQEQYLDMYVRTHKKIRSDPTLNKMLISGPSSSSQPSINNRWFTNWLARVQKDNVIPDQYAWHDEPGDVANDARNFDYLLKQYGAPEREININEYAIFQDQVSSGAAWWISRLERYNMIGLRGNWLSKCQLRDFLASLLVKTNNNDCSGTGYAGNGEFQVYKYYAQNMTGERATTSGTGDGIMDVFATVGSDKVRILTGVINHTGTWFITIRGLSAVGLPSSGTLNIQTYGFVDKGHWTAVDAPTNRGSYGHQYSGDSVTFAVFQTAQDKYTAWGFEFNVGANTGPSTTTTTTTSSSTSSATATSTLGPNDDCGPQAKTSGPVTNNPDTAEAFSANPVYKQSSDAASAPSGYTNSFKSLTFASSNSGSVGTRSLTSYDPAACAAFCNSNSKCKAFNIFFRRDPTLKPADACPNPVSQTYIGCAMYDAPLTAAKATNSGQYRRAFRTVYAGSSGWNKN